MSTIYTDGAGNKYLGDCQWGNHDINYPTTNYLETSLSPQNLSEFSAAFTPFLVDAGFSSVSITTTALGNNTNGLNAVPPSGGPAFRGGNYQFGWHYWNPYNTSTTDALISAYTRRLWTDGPWRMASSAGDSFFHLLHWNYNSTYTSLIGPTSNVDYTFVGMGKLLDVNPNFNYYTPAVNHRYRLYIYTSNGTANIQAAIGAGGRLNTHYIASASKALLETGRAAYTISCSDGQIPGEQWATDMWVYDNNATLGYPVIGRVPNMLLGIGTYTYLKPVKIQGSVFPDNGSPWYLPVGTFAEKTLLMRCYSSIT